MNKTITLFDQNKIREKHKIGDTEIIFKNDLGEVLFVTKNKLILPGAGFTARSHFDISTPEITPSYNATLQLENSVEELPSGKHKTFLFAVGTDGCGPENSQKYPVDYKKWISPEALVPFRYCTVKSDISSDLRKTYFGRKTVGDFVAYYFKAFEGKPTLHQLYADGTPLDNKVYESEKGDEAETYVEINLKISKEDCREYFTATTGINEARVNTISLLTAWAKDYSGTTYYQDIRPLTKLNITNEPLIDLTKGLDIIYHVYY